MYICLDNYIHVHAIYGIYIRVARLQILFINIATLLTINPAELIKLVLKDNSDRLKAELKIQNVFKFESIDYMSRDDLVRYVVTLRTLAGQTESVRQIIPAFVEHIILSVKPILPTPSEVPHAPIVKEASVVKIDAE